MNKIENQIKEKLITQLQPTEITIINQSHLHSSHFTGNNNGESHFKIIIESELLSNLTRVKAHRVINDILKEELANDIHALSIKIK